MMSRILLLVLGLFYCLALSAQTLNPCKTDSYFKTFGTTGTDEQGISLLPASDGGLYTTGAVGKEALLTKLDSNGQIVWSRTLRLDSSRQVLLYELISDSDGMLVAVGTEGNVSPLQLPSALVFRYDPVNDTIMWVKRIDSGIALNAGILEKKPGGNFIFYQTIVTDTTLRSEVEILELDRTTGDAVAGKGKRISRTEAILFSTMLMHNDSLYAVGAWQLPNPSHGIRHLLTRLDTVGFNPDWARSSHLDTVPSANFIAEDLLVDNDTLVSLYADVDTTGGNVSTTIFLQKTTLSGNLVWVKQYNLVQTTNEAPIDLVQLDSGYAIYGIADDHYFFLPVDHDGNAKNAFTLNGAAFTTVAVPLPFAKNEAYAAGKNIYLNGGFAGADVDMSLVKTQLGLNVTDSCGYIQPLDSVTSTAVLNPFSQTISMQISPSQTVPVDTSASFVAVTLNETRLCPVLSPTDTLDLGPDIITCLDTSFVLDAGPGYASYLWQDSSTMQTLTTTGTGVYWVEVTDSCGIVQRDSILVTVNLSGDTQFPDQTICRGDSVTLNVPGFDTYLWAPNVGLSCDTCATVTITPDSTRQYTLTATSVDGCFLSDTFLLTVALPSATFDTLTACDGDSLIFNGITYFVDTLLVDTLSPTQGGCDTIATTLIQFSPRPTGLVTVTRCQGDVFVLNGTPYTQNNVVTVNVPSPTGCDSVLVYTLNFLPLPQLTDTVTACANDTIFLGGQAYTADTILIDTLTATTGCDTVRTRQLIFSSPIQADTLTACAGDSITFGGIVYTQNTTLTLDTLPASGGGCDTLVQTILIFNPIPIQADTLTACAGDSISFGGIVYFQDTTLTLDTLPATGSGCDTLVQTILVFNPLPTRTDTTLACAGDSISLGGTVYTQDTTVTITLPATTGCDTIVTTQLIFRVRPIQADTMTACAGDSISLGGVVYSQDTTVTIDTLPASGGGCDTLVQTILVFNPVPTTLDTISLCQGDSISIDGVTYFTNTSLVDTLTATTGCDTIRTRQLVFNPAPTRTDTTLACAGDTISLGGFVYTQDTTVTTTIPAVTGCDTLVTTQLIFRTRPVQTDTLTACAGDSLTFGGIVYTQDTTLTLDTLPATGGGCDTLVQTILVFNPVPIQSDTLTACAGDSISFGGIVYLQDTTLTIDTLPATGSGCDTLVQRILIFNPLQVLTDTLTACEGDSLLVGGVNYFADTTLVDTLSATIGCDTIRTRQLIFNPVPTRTDTTLACAGDSINLGGTVYTQDTVVTISVPASVGCDTLVTTQLIFRVRPIQADTMTACAGDSITFGGVVYSQDTTLTLDTLPSTTGGCDTLVQQILIFNPAPTTFDTISLCQGDTVTVGGVQYFQATTLVDTIPSTTGGCDTISTLNIIILPLIAITDTVKFLPGDTVTVNGVQYVFPVILVDTLPSATGCDTVLTTVLQWITKFTLTCPPDLTVTTAPGTPTTIVDYDLPTVNTQCPGGGQPTITLLSGIPIGGTFGLGTTEICYTAADTCGNVDTCCFKITVVEGEMACDVKTNGCFRWEMLPIKLDSVGNRRYRIKVVNNCAQKLDYVLFRLPNGINALAPANNSIYTSPTSSPRKYIVRNPNFSPVYSVRFKADSSTVLNNGVSDIFEYKLPQQSQPKYIYTYAKLADGTYFESHLNVFNCPELPWPNFVPDPNDRNQATDLSGAVEMYPNPTDGILFLNLAEVPGETVFIRVLNTLGEEVQTARLPVADGLQSLQLDTRLQSGVYQLVVQPKDGPAVVERFVLQRN